MVSSDPQNPICFLDALYCEEEDFDLEKGFGFQEENVEKKPQISPREHDIFWDKDEILCLLSKEKQTHFLYERERDLICNGSLMVARKEGLDWMFRVSAHYGFVAMTRILAVNYFDRFLFSPCFQRDKPWMSQLAAVSCISLAAKVEETQAPLLLDLQVEESKFVFESKTIMRMELLVLSTLQWKMNRVTPLSFFDYIVSKLGLKTQNARLEFLRKCEGLLLSVIADSRFLGYLPSMMAAAIMCLVIKEVEPCNALECQNQIKGLLDISKEKVDDCSKLVLEVSDGFEKQCQAHKRKHHSTPGSPNGVVDAYFSSDSSNDSWAVASSVSFSREPLFKKSRAQDQQMRLAPLNRMFMGVLSSRR